MCYETHKFFCINCGQESIPLARNAGFKKGKFHRKKLWCIHCQQEVNHIECQTMDDVEEFRLNFENGVYKDEAQESLSFVRGSRIG